MAISDSAALAETAVGPRLQGLLGDTAATQALDPLRCDRLIARLPEMNARADTGSLVRVAGDLLPTLRTISAFSVLECVAAMRDLGMVAGSIKRHGIDPLRALPGMEPVLVFLGQRTDMVPRDTIYHYTEANPPGDRRRTYTGTSSERLLQDSVRLGLPALLEAIDHCRRLKAIAVTDCEFKAEAAKLSSCMREYLTAFDRTWQSVDPEYFARVLRPYFEEFSVMGQVLMGPAAAHVPLGLIDLALWASDDAGGDGPAGFRAEAARYTPQPWRVLYTEWTAGPSLVTRVLQAGEAGSDARSRRQAGAGAQALADTLQALLVFRGRHWVLARRAYKQGVRLYELGSGGGTLQLLEELTDLTREHAGRVRPATRHG